MTQSQTNAIIKGIDKAKELNETLSSTLPSQRLTEKEKIKEYGSVEEWVRYTVQSFRNNQSVFHRDNPNMWKEVMDNFNLLNGKFDQSQIDYVNEFNRFASEGLLDTSGASPRLATPKFPAQIRHYDIISTAIERIRGEELKRPIDCRVISTNMETINSKLEEKNESINEQIERDLILKMAENPQLAGILNPQAVTQAQTVPSKTAQQINKEINSSYKEKIETYGDIALRYITEKDDLKFKFYKGLDNTLCSYLDCYYVGRKFGEPYMRVVDPRYLDYDKTLETHFIEDCSWVREIRFPSVSGVYDEFGEYLTDEDIEYLENVKGNLSSTDSGYETSAFAFNSTLGGTSYSDTIVKLTVVEWKSLKKVGHLCRYSEGYEDAEETIVDEYFDTKGWKVKKEYVNNAIREVLTSPSGDTLTWYWIQEVWEAVEVNDDRIIHFRVKPNQYRSLTNPMEVKLGYCGVIIPYPLMEKLKPYQYLYNIIMYRLELTIAKAKGQVGLIDIAQLPFSKGFNLSRFLYYLDTMGIAFINSMEEGEGSQAGRESRFNNWTTLDLSLSNSIASYIGILDKLEMMAERSSGITPQAKGAISQYETARGVNSAIQQSSYVTESIFYLHSQARKRALKQLLDISTICWKDGKKGYYFLSDGQTVLFDIEGEVYSSAEFDLHISDNIKYERISQFLEMNAMTAIQSDQVSLGDVMAVLESDSLLHKRQILDLAKEARAAQMAEQQSDAELERQLKERIEQAKIESQERISQMDNQTKLQIAAISADSKLKDDIRNTPEFINEEQRIEEDRLREETLQKEKDRELVKQKQVDDKQLKERELDIKEKDLIIKRNKPTSK